jgi:hypothetical protein
MINLDNQHVEARIIARKLAPFSQGVFVVGSVAYDPLAVQDKLELEVIVVIDDFRKTDFEEIGVALGRELNPHSVKCASQGKIGVFDIHYTNDFATGIYFRSSEAHRAVCNLGSYGRFTNSNSTPRSCALRSLDGDNKLCDNFSLVEGGRIYTHYSVLEQEGKLWLGFPATNLLMDPMILTGRNFLQTSFDEFYNNLKRKILERYGDGKRISLINSVPEHLVGGVPDMLRTKLDLFLE